MNILAFLGCRRWEYGQLCYSRNFQESGKKCDPYLLKLITWGYFEQHIYVFSVISIIRKGIWFQRQEISEARLLFLLVLHPNELEK